MIKHIIKLEEGFRPRPYLCSEGYVTIGYGTKLHSTPNLDPSKFELKVTEEAALALLKSRVSELRFRLRFSSRGAVFQNLSEERQSILLSMAYQMGISGVLQFKNMWAALEAEDYRTAAIEMLDSKWANQTRARATRHSTALMYDTLEMYKG